jgi:outer membrane biosynthesis protein TonB
MNTSNPSPSTLKWALAISLAIHAALLTMRFAAPETFKRVFEDAPLEVLLVNVQNKIEALEVLQFKLPTPLHDELTMLSQDSSGESDKRPDKQAIDNRGQLIDAEIANNLGKPLLDNRALAIARHTAPFDAFSAKMRSSADQIVMVSRLRFTRDEVLKTVMQNPSEQTP